MVRSETTERPTIDREPSMRYRKEAIVSKGELKSNKTSAVSWPSSVAQTVLLRVITFQLNETVGMLIGCRVTDGSPHGIEQLNTKDKKILR